MPRAASLVLDSSSVTAFANAGEFGLYFQQMVKAIGKSGDILIGLIAERSSNVVSAFRAGREMGLVTLGFLGGIEDHQAAAECDLPLVISPSVTARIEEAHLTAGHGMMEIVEDLLLDRVSEEG